MSIPSTTADNDEDRACRRTLTRSAPVRISAGLLLFQAAALLLLVWLVWQRLAPLFSAEAFLPAPDTLDALLLLVILAPVSILAAPAAAGLFARRRWAWLLAMLIEAALLGLCLYFYFGLRESVVTRNGIIYAIMASCIVLVLYLNSTDVRLAAGTVDPRSSAGTPASGEAGGG